MKEFIEFLVRQLVDNPDKVIVEENTPDDKSIEFTLKVDKSDTGKVIGKKGQNITAIRTLLSAVSKGQHRTTLELADELNKS